MSKDTIVIDLDGTLCDCSPRIHLAQAKQWDEFHAGMGEDKIREDVALLMDRFSGYMIIILTGRDEAYRKPTEDWLRESGVGWTVDALLMRPDGNREQDHVLKPRLLAEHFGSLDRARKAVLMILEDRDRVVQEWRDLGFTCWQVQAGAY
jgi:FMN phosphatase YigB (HAD superfamily)